MSDIGGGGKQAATKDQTLDETTDLQLADVSEIPLEQSNLEMGEDDFGNVSGIPPEFQMDGDLSMIEGGVAADADEANRTNDADADAFAMDQTIGNDTTILDEQPEDVSLAKGEGEGEDAEQQEIGFGEIAAIAPEADTGTTRREKAKGRKRRMVIDVNLEIPSAEMRRGLEPHGPDDISRRPYRKKRGAFDFDRLPLTGKMHDYLLQDNSAEAMFTRSNIPGLCPKLDRMFTRFMVTTPRPSLDQVRRPALCSAACCDGGGGGCRAAPADLPCGAGARTDAAERPRVRARHTGCRADHSTPPCSPHLAPRAGRHERGRV